MTGDQFLAVLIVGIIGGFSAFLGSLTAGVVSRCLRKRKEILG
jgi:hypothetical protein